MCAPFNCFLWYFISRAVLVDRISELYPPAEETLTEQKLREAFCNCLARDETFRSTTQQVRDSFLEVITQESQVKSQWTFVSPDVIQLSEVMQGLHINVKYTTTMTFTNHQKLKLKLKIKKLTTIFYLLASKHQTSEFMMKKFRPCAIKSNHTRI